MAEPVIAASAAHSIYEVLKDFQPALAAMIALFAASLAYEGAMAKVNLEIQTRDEDRVRERYGLCFRLQVAARRMSRDFSVYEKATNFHFENYDVSIPAGEQPEFEEAWKSLTLVPLDCIEHLEKARFFLRFLRRTIDQQKAIGIITLEVKVQLAGLLKSNCKAFSESCAALATSLDSEIARLKGILAHSTPSQRASQRGVFSRMFSRSSSRQNSVQ